MQRVEGEAITVPDSSVSKELKKKKLAVFVSGGGSNFRSIYEATLEGTVHGEVAVLVTNKNGRVFFGKVLFFQFVSRYIIKLAFGPCLFEILVKL